MAVNVGVWVDHREAVVVRLSGSDAVTVNVKSDSESQLRRASDHPSGSFESLQVPSDDTRERKRKQELKEYYQQLIPHMQDAEQIAIYGPGEAKKELQKTLHDTPLAEKICDVEAADRMTEAQFVAKVKNRFAAD